MPRDQESHQINIQQYITDFFHHIGAMVEVPTYALLEVLIPEEYLDYFEGEEVLRLAFDPEVAEEEQAPFIIPGSPLLDTINTIILQEEKVLWRHVLVDSTSLPGHIQKRINKEFTFFKCRPPILLDQRLEEHHYMVFLFQISLISDERIEHLERIPVDLHKNLPEIEIIEPLESAFYQTKKNQILPMPPMVGLYKALETGLEKVQEIGEEHKREFQKRLKRFKEEEMEKLHSFYTQTEREMQEKLEKLEGIEDLEDREDREDREDKERDQKKKENLLQKIEANALDRERRIQDIEEKFSCRIEMSLKGLIIYSIPKIRIYLDLQQRQETYQLEVLYNPLTYQVEEPLCNRCKKRMRSIYFKNREALCSLCERR